MRYLLTTISFAALLICLGSTVLFASPDSAKVYYEAEPIQDIRKFVVYPSDEYKAGKEGTVKALLFIDTSGKVQKVTIITGTTTNFSDAVMKAAPKALYKPALDINGKKIDSWYKVSIVFAMQKKSDDNHGPIPITNIEQLTMYPPEAKRVGKEGRVEVYVYVSTDGAVYKTEIKSSTDSVFNSQALEAAGHMIYKPAMRSGKPVQTRFVLPVEFKLKK